MARNRGKTISFDVMVKFFIKQYGLPTKKDIDRIVKRLDRLEKLVKRTGKVGRSYGRETAMGEPARLAGQPATEIILSIINQCPKGIRFIDLQRQSGFAEKKLRNIIYRLDKNGWIQRVNRGVYVSANQ